MRCFERGECIDQVVQLLGREVLMVDGIRWDALLEASADERYRKKNWFLLYL
jgi:hypothetical protein